MPTYYDGRYGPQIDARETEPPPPPNPSRFHHDVAHTPEEIAHRIHWEKALDAGLIEIRNPPPPAEVVAINQANDRLFRERAKRRRRGAY